MRTCVVSNEKLPKKELLRIVKTPENEIKIDETGKMNGRGAYIKRSLDVVDLAEKNKALERHLECEISKQVYDEIRELLK
jgi:predicted RNA-binding protein YlxR (DUF448 family)